MQDFEQNTQTTSLQSELSDGNIELGELFSQMINSMVVPSGITDPHAEAYDVVTDKWRKLADKPNKSSEELKELDDAFKTEVQFLAESYLLYMATLVKNLTGKLNYNEYEEFMLKCRFARSNMISKPDGILVLKSQIKNSFNKISAHGKPQGDNLIDKKDMSAYIFALATKAKRDENNNFVGFEINGIVKPSEYALAERQLFDPEENLFSVKLRVAYDALYQ